RSSTPDLNPSNTDQSDTERSYTKDGEEVLGINIPLSPPVSQALLQDIRQLLQNEPQGPCPVYLIIQGDNYDTRCISTGMSVFYNEDGLNRLYMGKTSSPIPKTPIQKPHKAHPHNRPIYFAS
ncbi:MAG: hypothetical protein ABEI13_04460, partial [Candidatus Paceibacteria bacterium]